MCDHIEVERFIINTILVNPKQAGGSESMYSQGGRLAPPPLEKGLENRYRVEMHVHSPIFQGQLEEKKFRPITLIVWVLGRVKHGLKKCQRNEKIFFFALNKYQSVTHVSTSIFQGFF